MKKNLVLTALAAGMAFMLLTGCGEKSQTETEASAAESGKTEEAQDEGSETIAEGVDVDWPKGTVNFINPSAAGGETDIYGRIFNRYLEKQIGTTAVTTNMNGGGGSIATNEVANSSPDGQTILIFHNGFLINNLMGLSPLGVDDFKIAGIVCLDSTQGFFAMADAPYDTMAEMIDYVKGGGEVQMATEVGSFSYFQTLAIQKAADVEFDVVDAGTTPEKIAAMMAGNVDVMGTNYATMRDYVASGKMKCLGYLREERLAEDPDVSTLKEQGYDIVFDKFFFIAFPKETDQAIVDKCSQALVTIANDPEYQEELAGYCAEPCNMTAEEATEYIKDIEAQYKELIN